MNAVYKYKLCAPGESIDVEMSSPSRVLRVDMQRGELMLWALVGTGPREMRRFAVYATGDRSIPLDANYVGTVMDGPYVWHVFEVTR